MTDRKRARAEQAGRLAELAALWALRLKGYRLVKHRFKCAVGEIDLIMRKAETTAFVEVKVRPNHDLAVIAVSPYQSKRIAAAARVWMARDPAAAAGFCRFDIVAVSPYLWPRHIENAFFGE
jgi:putative endonuclease